MFSQHFDLLNNCHIQYIAVCIAPITAFPLAPLLHLADIGVNRLTIRRYPLGQLGIHPFPAGAVDQSSQKCLIVSWLAIGL